MLPHTPAFKLGHRSSNPLALSMAQFIEQSLQDGSRPGGQASALERLIDTPAGHENTFEIWENAFYTYVNTPDRQENTLYTYENTLADHENTFETLEDALDTYVNTPVRQENAFYTYESALGDRRIRLGFAFNPSPILPQFQHQISKKEDVSKGSAIFGQGILFKHFLSGPLRHSVSAVKIQPQRRRDAKAR